MPWWLVTASFFSCTYFGEGNGNPLQYSCLENHMERGAWQVTVHRVVKSETRLSNWAATTCTYLPFLYLLCRNNYCQFWCFLIYLWFCCPCFWYYIQECIAKSNVMKLSPMLSYKCFIVVLNFYCRYHHESVTMCVPVINHKETIA